MNPASAASSTVSIVPRTPDDPTPMIAGRFAALLMREVLAPLSAAMGFYGDLVTDAASEPFERAVEESMRGGAR